MAGTFMYYIKVNHAAKKTNLIFASKTVQVVGMPGGVHFLYPLP